MIALSNWTNHWSIQIENSVIRIHAGHMEHVKSLVIRTHVSVRMGGGKPQFSYHFFIFWRKAWKFNSFIIFNKNIEKIKTETFMPNLTTYTSRIILRTRKHRKKNKRYTYHINFAATIDSNTDNVL